MGSHSSMTHKWYLIIDILSDTGESNLSLPLIGWEVPGKTEPQTEVCEAEGGVKRRRAATCRLW